MSRLPTRPGFAVRLLCSSSSPSSSFLRMHDSRSLLPELVLAWACRAEPSRPAQAYNPVVIKQPKATFAPVQSTCLHKPQTLQTPQKRRRKETRNPTTDAQSRQREEEKSGESARFV